MKTARGVITLAQEHRFQLVDDQGKQMLFILHHGSPVQGEDLVQLARVNQRVVVSYEDSRLLNAHKAHEVYEDTLKLT